MAQDLIMTYEADHEIIVTLKDVTQLFVAPDINPFANTEVEVLGETGLSRVIQLMLAWRVRSRALSQLTIRLPSDKVEPGTVTAVVDAIQRYGQAKIEDN